MSAPPLEQATNKDLSAHAKETAEATETIRGELQVTVKTGQDESLFLNNKISQLKKDLEARCALIVLLFFPSL